MTSPAGGPRFLGHGCVESETSFGTNTAGFLAVIDELPRLKAAIEAIAAAIDE